MLYAGMDEFVTGCERFVRQGIERDEPVLVVVGRPKIERLKSALGRDAARVEFRDMADVGANPARIIPAWRDFVDAGRGRRVWGIGEPIYPERTETEMTECHRHEALLNLAFARDSGFTLLCPYDVDALSPEVVAEARCNHPILVRDGVASDSEPYTGLGRIAAPFDDPLPEPSTVPAEVAYPADALWLMRRLVGTLAQRFGLPEERIHDLVLAVNEIAGNSARHTSGGQGILRIWREHDSLVCEVRDDGRIDDPLAGRRRPAPGQEGGYGLWLANVLCDLVQVRSFPTGSVVRLHMKKS